MGAGSWEGTDSLFTLQINNMHTSYVILNVTRQSYGMNCYLKPGSTTLYQSGINNAGTWPTEDSALNWLQATADHPDNKGEYLTILKVYIVFK